MAVHDVNFRLAYCSLKASGTQRVDLDSLSIETEIAFNEFGGLNSRESK
jgi:hypothetical protein